ncbi:MAG: hypothetical protein HY883_07755 [Deltaproteobacteria bacterium]|nr:hypothetical protein [Deltaproteobacteria bacterium]
MEKLRFNVTFDERSQVNIPHANDPSGVYLYNNRETKVAVYIPREQVGGNPPKNMTLLIEWI